LKSINLTKTICYDYRKLHSEPQENNVNETENIVKENVITESISEPETQDEEIHDEVEQHEHEN
jgi:hypothetical protein